MASEKMSVEKMYKKKKKKLKVGETDGEAESPAVHSNPKLQEGKRAGKAKKKKELESVSESMDVDDAAAAAAPDSESVEEIVLVKPKKKNAKKRKAAAKVEDDPAMTTPALPSSGKVEKLVMSKSENKYAKKQKAAAAKVENVKMSALAASSGENVEETSLQNGEVMAANPRGKSAPAALAGMQIYWNLSSVDADLREEAAGALVRELVLAQRDFEENRSSGMEERAAEAAILGEAKDEDVGLQACAPALHYALRRLIRGVASSREGARQGFSLALASVLETLSCVDSAAVLRMIDKHLEVTSSMKGQEARDALLGQLFAFGALVRMPLAEKSVGKSEQVAFVQDLTERLLTVGRKKVFLLEAAIHILAKLGEKLESSVVKEGVCEAPLFSEVMQGPMESTSPDHLFLALRLCPKLPNSTIRSWTVIPDSGNLIDIFEKEHLSRLALSLKESTKSHPRVHDVWEPLIQVLFSDSKQLESAVKKSSSKGKKKKRDVEPGISARLSTFWNTIVDDHLLKSSLERKHLAFELLIKFLPNLQNPLDVERILSKSIVQSLVHACSDKDLLHKTAKNCIAEVCKWAEGNDERRVSVVIALQRGSEGKFDQTSKTQSVKGLVGGLSSITGYQAIFESLSKFYLSGEGGETGGPAEPSRNSKKQKLVEDSEGSENDDTNDGTQDTEALQRKWALDHLRALCQQAMVGLQADVVVEELINKFVSLLTPARPFTEEEEQSLSTLQTAVTQVSKLISKVDAGETKDRLQAMLSLLVQLLFESQLNPKIALDNASEIAVCCKKAFGDLQLDIGSEEISAEEEGDEEPAYMDVLVDVLLSLLAQSSAPIRAAAEQVFKSFSSDLTSSGISDLLRIVKKNTQRSRHKPAVEVDSDEAADDEDVVDVEDSDDDVSEEENNDANEVENDDDSGSSDEDKEEPSGKNSRASQEREKDRAVAKEGKETEDDGDDEEDEGEDSEAEESADDEAMFRMDKTLANLLKQRKQGGGPGTNESKDAQTQLLHFKFRVFSLLEYFVQKHSSSVLVLTILPSLLHVYVNSCTTDGNGQIADRVRSILLNKLFKGREYPRGAEVDQETLKGLLKRALKLASKSTVKGVSPVAQGACHWLLKVIHGNLEQGKDGDVEEMVSGALDLFFVHKKCRLPSAFFKDVFIRNPALGQSSLGGVLERSKSARSECLRFEAIQLTGTILGFKSGKSSRKSKQSGSDVSSQQTAAFVESYIPSIKSVIIHLLKAAPTTKSNRRSEALQFCVSCLDLYRTLYPGRPIAELLPADILASAVKEVSAPAKSKQAILLEKLQQ